MLGTSTCIRLCVHLFCYVKIVNNCGIRQALQLYGDHQDLVEIASSVISTSACCSHTRTSSYELLSIDANLHMLADLFLVRHLCDFPSICTCVVTHIILVFSTNDVSLALQFVGRIGCTQVTCHNMTLFVLKALY